MGGGLIYGILEMRLLEYIDIDVWKGTEEDSVGKPLYSRFIKANDFKGVPHPLSGDYTPKPQEEIDESLYVYGKKGPQEPEPSVSDDRSSEYSTCQSNDSAGSIGTSSEHSVDLESEISRVPSEVYVSTPITTTEKGVSAPKSKEVEPSCVSHIKTPRQPIKDQATPKVNRKKLGNAMVEEKTRGRHGKEMLEVPRVKETRVCILDTLSVLGKFNGKSDEGFLIGYSLNSKAYRVYNLVTKRVEVNLHVNFLEDKPKIQGLEVREKDEDVELIVMPLAVKNTEEKVESRTSSTNSKKEEILTGTSNKREGFLYWTLQKIIKCGLRLVSCRLGDLCVLVGEEKLWEWRGLSDEEGEKVASSRNNIRDNYDAKGPLCTRGVESVGGESFRELYM
ncbi:hypothetical protein Tco_1068984 [Tanacetum coccineum]|uniref:Retroviral polymerase SH3-like domain-containing protein n=1 Tax=Tanacetum coccineum TaxID=301880 RepID=A0ABQ5HJ33_9ASTR